MDHQIACPGCGQPLHVPASALGKSGQCPHCKADFRLPADATGEAALVRRTPSIPRVLVVPGFGLLMLGLAGTLVNGYLAGRMVNEPGFDLEFARGRVQEVRSAEAMSGAMSEPADWSGAPGAAAGGVAAVQAGQELADERLAASWAQGMVPLHVASTAISALALLGGVAILRGRWYPLALAGCVAAALNVNHLCCLPGAVAGVWGFMALMRDDVREHFRRNR